MHTFHHRNDKVFDKALTMYESILQLILLNLYHFYMGMNAYLSLMYNV